jgi:hypothetical protein
MKLLLTISIASFLFFGCSSDSDDSNTPTQEEEVVDQPNEPVITPEPEENLTIPEDKNETPIVVVPEENLTIPEDKNETPIVVVPEKTTLSIPLCDDGVEILESGDIIIKVSENPQIELVHSASGDKTICVKDGEAEIERK